jgi:hypothetical protein
MRTLVWASRTGCVSARRLYSYIRLHKPSGERLVFRCRDSLPNRRFDSLINYGKRSLSGCSVSGVGKVFNGNLPVNKFSELETILPYSGDSTDGKVITPKFSRNLVDVSFPMLIRTDNHCRGNGLWFVGDTSSLPNINMSNKYYIKYIPKDSEYRIHCVRLNGVGMDSIKVLKRQKRVHRSPSFHSIKWNQEYGWGLSPVDLVPASVIGAAKRAMLRLDYDFGAVDVMFKDGRAYVIEVNSAPGLNDNTCALYGDYFLSVLYGGV